MCNEKAVGRCTWRKSRRVRVLSRDRGTFNSTEGEPQYRDAGERWWRRARRRCMKAKALQTIVTLYMTSSCYNNTAVIYCTVQVRLNIWLDKADHSLQQQFCPDSVCVCLFFSIFSYHSSYLFLLFNSTWVCIYTYLKHNMKKKHKKTTYTS